MEIELERDYYEVDLQNLCIWHIKKSEKVKFRNHKDLQEKETERCLSQALWLQTQTLPIREKGE